MSIFCKSIGGRIEGPSTHPNRFVRWIGFPDRAIGWLAANPPRTLTLLAAYALFLGLAQVLTILLGLLRIPISQPLALGVLAASALGGILFYIKYTRRIRRRTINAYKLTLLERLIGYAGVAGGLLFFGALSVFAIHNPDVSWDGMTYHTPPIHFWSLRGYVHWIDLFPKYDLATLKARAGRGGSQDEFINGFPKGIELMSFLLYHATHNDLIITLGNHFVYPLGILGIIYLARIFGASQHIAAAAGFAFIYVPVLVSQSVSMYVDAGFAAAAIATMATTAALCGDALRFRPPGLRAPAWVGLACAGGLAMGIKFTGIAFVVFAFGFAGSCLLMGWMLKSRRAAPLGRNLLLLSAAAASCVAVGGYWYLRNWYYQGNPTWPMQLALGGHVLWDGLSVNLISSVGADWASKWGRAKQAWLQGGAHWPESLKLVDSQYGGIGFMWLYGCVPAIILFGCCTILSLIIRPRLNKFVRSQNVALLACLGSTLLIFKLLPDINSARYTHWVYGLGLPAFATVCSASLPLSFGAPLWLRAAAIELRAGLLVVFLAGIGWMAYEGNIVRNFNRQTFDTLWTYQDPQHQLPRRVWTPYDIAVCSNGTNRAIPNMKTIMESTAPAAYGSFPSYLQSMLTPGVLSRPFGVRPLFFITDAIVRNPARFMQFVREHKIKYLFLDNAVQLQDGVRVHAEQELRTQFLYLVEMKDS